MSCQADITFAVEAEGTGSREAQARGHHFDAKRFINRCVSRGDGVDRGTTESDWADHAVRRNFDRLVVADEQDRAEPEAGKERRLDFLGARGW